MGRLTGKTAIITGASAGIGYASALELAREGSNLIVTARREERLDKLAHQAGELGAAVKCIAGDARDEDTAARCVEAALDSFGRLDIMINNVGVGIYKQLIETSADEYDEMMDSNMRSSFLFTRYAVPVMIRQKGGTLLFISSMAGKYGFAGEAVYCASKFAQVGFAQALDNELRHHGIQVGVICPGGVKTEFAIGTGRTTQGVSESDMLEAGDVAKAVLLACTQSSSARIIEIQMRPMVESLT